MDGSGSERFDAVVVGGGQAGLSAGHYLKKAGRSFVILDAHERVGDNWRERYDSLRLFTPAYASSLPGWKFPAKGFTTPLKDDVADYLEAYTAKLALPVRTGVRVDGVRREGDTYIVSAGAQRFEAANVVVATGAHREARVPALARELDPMIVQLHSTQYRNPSQLRDGGVLVVGAGNSGADIALETVTTHATWLAGRIRGHIPFDIDTGFSRHVAFRLVRFIGVHVLTLRTPMGRRARDKAASQGGPLVRVKPKWLDAAGIRRVGKVIAVQDGLPVLEDGQVLDVANVIWCTGFRHDLSWIDLPIFGEDGAPMHDRGVVAAEPGLYFVGLPFQFSSASDVLPGVGRDARYVVRRLLARARTDQEPGGHHRDLTPSTRATP
jgi:putative flavoprotein involved in K+ transport